MTALDALKVKLAAARKGEKNAMRKLRLAQTVFDKWYDKRNYYQEQLDSLNTQAEQIAVRLLGKDKSQ
jgi:hypothetical protein